MAATQRADEAVEATSRAGVVQHGFDEFNTAADAQGD